MARVKIVLDKTGIRADANRFSTSLVKTVTRRVLTRSAILCPVDTGLLRSSGRMKFKESARGPAGLVEYPVKYAAAVHDGVGPQVIRARKKKALRFKYQGKTVIVKSVRTRGHDGKPFLRRAAQEIAAEGGYRFIRRN